MNIVQIAPYYPPHVGGAEKSTERLCKLLSSCGINVVVITSDINNSNNSYDKHSKIDTIRLKSIEIAHTPIIPSLFFELLKIKKSDIVHLNVSQAFIPEITYIVSKINKFKYISHIHADVGPTGILGCLLPFYKKYILKYVLRSSSSIICQTNNNRILIGNKYDIPLEKIVVIPNSIDKTFSNYKWLIKKRHKIKILLYVGRISEEKNVELLIRAMPLIKHPCILNIVGEGNLLNQIKDIGNKLGVNNVSYKGTLSGIHLMKEYDNADIFISPSSTESMSRVLMEAMCAHLPVIAMDFPNNREYYSKTALLVKESDALSVAKSVDYLISNPSISSALSSRGHRFIQNFTEDKILKRFLKVYERTAYEN